MAYVTYQGHTIVSSAVLRSTLAEKWTLAASVSSQESGRPTRRLHIVRHSPELFSRFEDAERAGMEAAKNCVDLTEGGGPFPLAIVPARSVPRRQL